MEIVRILESVIAIILGLAAVGGTLLVSWKWGGNIYRAYRAMVDLHIEFGSNPIGQLASIIREIEASHGEYEIRQRIAERHLAVGIYVCSPDGKCTWCNDWLLQAWGMDSGAIKGFGWLTAIRREDQQRVHEAWTRSVEEGTPYEEHYHVEPPNKSDLWEAYTEAWPVKNRAGKIICYVGYVRREEQ